ncbi:MAG: dTDP-4-dehydrorhamnose 3,5-epimerase [Proteobacteria bacterium]|nr:dTDP-4-dehydrorhamnose 3,5-epimerase [Pseudomonadota bacterium]
MKFIETPLRDAYIIELEPLSDERGFFARSWCQKEMLDKGLNTDMVQCNVSYNKLAGTLRGMHYQDSPHEEIKLVRCTNGSIYDVIIDLRPDSPTFKKWFGVQLSRQNLKMLYIPKLFAHGFLTLEDDTEVFYQMSEFYYPECAKGIRWNDTLFNIEWPEDVCTISDKDQTYQDFVI